MARLIAYSLLTTPTAYMTAIPKDPFQVAARTDRDEEVFQFQASNAFNTGNWSLPRQRGYTWGFNSIGPSLFRDGPTFINVLRGRPRNGVDSKTFIYDSTNGTKSKGMIIRTNKGDMTSPDMAPEV